MFKPLLAPTFILMSLMVLGPQPTRGFTVKLLGNDNTFGERRLGASEKENKVPLGDDVFPDPNGGSNTRESVSTSDELYLQVLSVGKPMTNDEIDAYLIKYGYLLPPVNGSVSENERKNAVKEFQRFSRLGETGVIDASTKKQMQKSRCGLTDPVSNSKLANFNAKESRKWQKKDLTYRIVVYSKKLPKSIVREWTKKAFKMWSDISQLTFTEVNTDSADIKLKFTPKNHGDGAPFDGPGGVLAHAFYPESGKIHLEEAEDWTVKSKKGTNLLFVLVHEIGHALGLGHSEVESAVMEPYYNGYKPNLALSKDDIAGIQFLYGKPTIAPPKPKPPTKAPVTVAPTTEKPNYPTTLKPGPTIEPKPPTRKFPCPFRFWAIMTAGDSTYGFFRHYLFVIHDDGRVNGRRSVRSVFRRGPRVVGAAAHNEVTGHTFLFVGRWVWRYTDHDLDRGFPKKLKYFVRAAVVVDEQLIAFSFTHIHILDEDTMEDYVDGEVTIRDEYPGLPTAIRAAVSYSDGLAYILYRRKAVQLDIYTGEMIEEKSCNRK